MNDKNEHPSIIEHSKDLAKFSLKLLNYLQNNDNDQNKALMVPDSTFNKRLDICKKCDKFDGTQNRCYECGCFIPTKAKFVLDSCPLNKWDFNTDEWEEIFNNILNDMREKNEK